MSTIFNTDISSYTITELMAIANIDEMVEEEIIEKTNNLIDQYRNTKKNVAEFFQKIQTQLLDYVNVNNLSENVENSHVYVSSVNKGIVNPLLNQTETRIIILDSRNITKTNGNKTNYVINLNYPLKNVISLRLHSYTIPYNWYVIDSTKNNHFFWILFHNERNQESDITKFHRITVSSGNYDKTTLLSQINLKLQQLFASQNIQWTNQGDMVTLNPNTGKINFHTNLFGGYVYKILFFDGKNKFMLQNQDETDTSPNVSQPAVMNKLYRNSSLGWILGFRVDEIVVTDTTGIVTAESIIDLNGSRYLYLIVDDFKRNRVSNNIVSIVEVANDIKLPNYFNNVEIPYECNDNVVNLLPTIPRTLTASQIYTINEIMNNKNKTDYYAQSPNDSDILAVLPIKSKGFAIGDLIIETNGQLQDNKREYYGPVTIERLNVKLLDDIGNIVNLNSGDWSITLLYECLYQFN